MQTSDLCLFIFGIWLVLIFRECIPEGWTNPSKIGPILRATSTWPRGSRLQTPPRLRSLFRARQTRQTTPPTATAAVQQWTFGLCCSIAESPVSPDRIGGHDEFLD